jgi:predicted N-acetyltransferase YhbS
VKDREMDLPVTPLPIGGNQTSSGASGQFLPIGEQRTAPIPAGSSSERDEGASPAFTIAAEQPGDIPAREALLDRAMGAGRKRKSSEKLRRGRMPSKGLVFVARDGAGRVVGTVRLWDVAFGKTLSSGQFEGMASGMLLLGPLAVDPGLKSAGIGSALMRYAVAEAKRLGHKAVLLVGDAPYYERFGFSSEKTGLLAMPGPYERERFLALELVPGALDNARGILRPAGKKRPEHLTKAA